MTEAPLELRFVQNLRRLDDLDTPRHLLVAVSGGLDSTVLLHLLRFQVPADIRLTAAHFDHRMRTESGEDAAWVQALCEGWGIEVEVGRAVKELRGETPARAARYGFLRETARRIGADAIVTAHHADDQAETVLFRILRGTGLHGLAGIPPRTRSGLLRPLLPFWRDELLAYAERNDLRWRMDASNATLGPVRNRIRLRILPEIERDVSRGARRHLVSLAELARESEAAWRALLRSARGQVIRREGDALVLARDRLRGYDRPVQARLVRDALRQVGIVATRAGTRIALAFITGASSGRELRLQGGATIRLEFDDARIERAGSGPEADSPLTVPPSGPGNEFSGMVRVGGRNFRVEARTVTHANERDEGGAVWRVRVPGSVDFPLTIRGRRPGDRVRTSGGTKSLKKLMIERRVPLRERSRRPVIVDARGAVLWVAGLETVARRPAREEPTLEVTFHDG